MAEYKGIKGFNIQTVSSDPANPLVGEVWYNSTSATVKYFAVLSAVLGLRGGRFRYGKKRTLSRSRNTRQQV
jgi:hypothetical protein